MTKLTESQQAKKDRDKKIYRLHKEGIAHGDISARLGISYMLVARVIQDARRLEKDQTEGVQNGV